jgi:hypothetical protein
MARKKKELKWNVCVERNGEFVSYNVFDHYSFDEAVRKDFKKYKDDFNAFADKLKSEAMYYYWSKCEWEMLLSTWPPCDRYQPKKVDVYDQLCLNWEQFLLYTWVTLGGALKV